MTRDKGLDILTMSLDYPELNMVKYDGTNDVILFELALNNRETNMQDNFYVKLKQCLDIYHKLYKINPNIIKLEIKKNHDIDFIRLYRDTETIDSEEIKLFINAANNFWGKWLIKDDYQYEDRINKHTLKRDIIEKIDKEINYNKTYLVYRQHGKVVVHNR